MKRVIRKSTWKAVFFVLNIPFLVIATWIWINLPYTFGRESSFIQLASVVVRLGFGADNDKPKPEDYLFINVSQDKTVVQEEEGFRRVIVDRKRLAQLFQTLNRYKAHKFIMCDILFDTPSPDDAQLQNEISLMDNILIANVSERKNNQLQFKKLAIKAPQGLVEYRTTPDGAFYKYKIADGQHLKSMPLLMYEHLHNAKFYYSDYFAYFMNNALSLNAMVVDFKVRNYDLQTFQYPFQELNDLNILLLGDDPEMIDIFIRNKILVIGNFSDDVVETSFGNISGSLLLLNVYLDLLDGENKITIWFILWLMLIYGLISYNLIYQILPSSPQSRLTRFREARFARWFGHFFILSFLSVASYLMFGILINIFLILLIIEIEALMIKLYKNSRKNGTKSIYYDFKSFFLKSKNKSNDTNEDNLLDAMS